MKARLLVLLIAAGICNTFSQAQSYNANYSSKDSGTEGAIYLLPRTLIQLQINVTRTTTFPGDFCMYAERYLRIPNAIKAKQSRWNINEITILPYGVPDTAKVGIVPIKKRTEMPLLTLTEDGLLLAINTDSIRERNNTPITSRPLTLHKTTKMDSRSYFTEEILLASSTTKMAELIAQEIYQTRDSKKLLSQGEADFMPKDGEQLRLMLARLDQKEAALLQLFTGYEEQEQSVVTLTYDPVKDVEDAVLFRFSPHLGVVDADDLAGFPIYCKIKNLQPVPNTAPLDAKALKKLEGSLRYNIPARTSFKLYSKDAVYYENTLPIAQFGGVTYLGSELFNKKNIIRAYFSPITGGLLKME